MSVCYTVISVDSEKEQARRFFVERFPVYVVNGGLSQKKFSQGSPFLVKELVKKCRHF